jgi:hypothetical protein
VGKDLTTADTAITARNKISVEAAPRSRLGRKQDLKLMLFAVPAVVEPRLRK